VGTRPGEGYDDDGDRLPWLETVEDDYREGSSLGRIVLLVVLVAAVLAAIGFGYWWYQRQAATEGNGELINAAEGDYKVKPDEPGGMQVGEGSSSAFAAGEGATGNASLATGEAEAPIQGSKAPAAKPEAGSAKATVVLPQSGGQLQPKPPAVAPGGAGSLVQLGAYPDAAGADTNWARVSRKYPYLASFGKSVERGDSNGKTVYRLRINAGSNTNAKDVCAKLKAAGEQCYVAN
jgi:hypothetical protein